MSKDVVCPPVKSTAHGDLGIRRIKRKPLRSFGYIPNSEDDHCSEVPGMCEGNCSAGTPKQIRAEIHKEHIKDTESRCCGPELVDLWGGVSLQAFEPKKITAVGRRPRVPE